MLLIYKKSLNFKRIQIMKLYNINDIHKALKKIGISKNDMVYICPEIYKLGKLDVKSKNEYIEVFLR